MATEIKTQDEYERAMAEVEVLIPHDPEPNTPDGQRLVILTNRITEYERRICEFAKPDPVEALRFRKEQEGR